MPGIEARNLYKHFGDQVAVDGLSFEVAPGEIYGLLGPNGAGKTTTLRMLAGLMTPTAGSAVICGLDVTTDAVAAKASLSFMTGTTGLYERLTPWETLIYFGSLYGIPRRRLQDRAAELVGHTNPDTGIGRATLHSARYGVLPSVRCVVRVIRVDPDER